MLRNLFEATLGIKLADNVLTIAPNIVKYTDRTKTLTA